MSLATVAILLTLAVFLTMELLYGGLQDVALLSGIDASGDDVGLTGYYKLTEYQPQPPDGWSLANTSGSGMGHDKYDFTFSRADYIFSANGAKAGVVIYDSGGKDIEWNSIFKTGFIYESADGYARTFKYKGYDAWEVGKYNPAGNTYTMYIRLNDHHGVAIMLKDAIDSSPLGEFADRINLHGIKALD